MVLVRPLSELFLRFFMLQFEKSEELGRLDHIWGKSRFISCFVVFERFHALHTQSDSQHHEETKPSHRWSRAGW